MTHTYVVGAAVGLNDRTLPGLQFNLEAAYTGCLICGELYQSRLDRKVFSIANDINHPLTYLLESYKLTADRLRKEWANAHARTHSESEHKALKESGQFCTPEAALKLTPLGIFPLDNDQSAAAKEVADAMLQAPRAPVNDVQG